MNAKKISAAAGTTQTITGSGTIGGFSIRENAGSAAAATVSVYDATSGTAIGTLLATLALAADSSKTVMFPKPLTFKVGVRTVITGTVAGSLFVS
jgi:hypothetical protein